MMGLNATIFGQIILLLAIIMAFLGYYLGKRKTQTPILTTVVAVISAFVPPLAILFLMALLLKNDVTTDAK